MQPLDRKSLARLRCLVAVARADGKLLDEEVQAIRTAFGGFPNPEQLDSVLSEEIDLAEEVLALGGAEERKAVYEAGYVIAYADGSASTEEIRVLKQIWDDKGEDTLFKQVLGEARDTVMPSSILPIADPAEREREVLEDTLKYATMSALVAAMALPGISIFNDMAVMAMQVKLVRDIGQYHNVKKGDKAVISLLGGLAAAVSAQVAVNTLVRFVPGVGNAMAAATSFATTFAVGRVANTYFEAGYTSLKEIDLAAALAEARKEGKAVFTEHQKKVDALKAEHGPAIKALNEDLAAGRIDQATYQSKLAELGI